MLSSIALSHKTKKKPCSKMAAAYEGIATMYMTMPMAAQRLPLLGACTVQDKKISLRFPLSNVSFDLPEAPHEGGRDMEFKMSGATGDMTLNISWKPELGAFIGQGKQGGFSVLNFCFYRANSPLAHLKAL